MLHRTRREDLVWISNDLDAIRSVHESHLRPDQRYERRRDAQDHRFVRPNASRKGMPQTLQAPKILKRAAIIGNICKTDSGTIGPQKARKSPCRLIQTSDHLYVIKHGEVPLPVR